MMKFFFKYTLFMFILLGHLSADPFKVLYLDVNVRNPVLADESECLRRTFSTKDSVPRYFLINDRLFLLLQIVEIKNGEDLVHSVHWDEGILKDLKKNEQIVRFLPSPESPTCGVVWLQLKKKP